MEIYYFHRKKTFFEHFLSDGEDPTAIKLEWGGGLNGSAIKKK